MRVTKAEVIPSKGRPNAERPVLRRCYSACGVCIEGDARHAASMPCQDHHLGAAFELASTRMENQLPNFDVAAPSRRRHEHPIR